MTRIVLAPLAVTAALALTTSASAQTTLTYWLWEAAQLPGYTQCVKNFQTANPDITVKIEQLAWDSYWTSLQTRMVAGNAPDVFTDHLAKYPTFAANNQLVDIAPLVARDKVPTNIYYSGLADLWTHSKARYGLPKDFDTITMFYNKNMIKAAGISEASLNSLTWNPDNGGTLGQTIAKLSLDKNGNNGLSAKYDKGAVKQYGFLADYTEGSDPYGQNSWSALAASTGWTYNNGLWGNKYNYDDPRYIKTMQWYADLSLVHGYAPPYASVPSAGAETLFSSGKVALDFLGSWQTSGVLKNASFPVGIAQLPIGAKGRHSMFNGLADSIWAGSKNKDAAWKLVKYLASPACANVIGAQGVVFPAIQSGALKSESVQNARGTSVSAFLKEANTKGTTFLFPITDNAPQIANLMKPALQSIFTGQAKAADVLPGVNAQVNALFH
jgi:multiple sugar transport system substrate-binding protein